MKILSLLPAGTEIVCALGAADELVGISHECDYPASVTALPRVTSSIVSSNASARDINDSVRELVKNGQPVFILDAEQISAMRPDVILTQSLCDVCAVSDGVAHALAHVVSPVPQVLPLVGNTLAGVWADIRAVGNATHRVNETEALLASLDARVRQIHETLKAARAPRPRVAVIEWLDPLFSAGHWTPDLVRRAGGVDVLAEPGAHSVQIDVAQVRDAAPDLLFFAPCGFDVYRATNDARELLRRPEWAWARDVSAWALDGNALTSRPGPRLVDAIETMASIIAPACFDPPAAHYAHVLR